MTDPRTNPIVCLWAREAAAALGSILATVERDGLDEQSRREIEHWAVRARNYAAWIADEINKPETRNEYGEPL